ncbi:MAG: amino acid adenylation domain-containing protein [Rhizobacter sp.]
MSDTRASLQNLSAAEMERLMRKARAAGLERQGRAPATIGQADRSRPLVLSFAQARLWFLAQMQGVSQAYHMPGSMRMMGAIDKVALKRALDRVVARHESLRTTFVTLDGEPVQRIAPEDSGFALREIDLASHAQPQPALQQLAEEEASRAFDFETGPLIRGLLVSLASDDHLLLVTMHHIVSDGWSMGVLEREVSTLYEAFGAGRDDPLPPLPIQYVDYAAWQREQMQGAVWKTQAEHWKATLRDAPPFLSLPTDHDRPAEQRHDGGLVPLCLEPTLVRGLRALSKRHGTTLFTTVMAAWAAVLSRLSGQDDLVIGTPVANRGRTDLEPLIGFFVNTLAVRVDLSGEPRVADLLGHVKTQLLAAQEHQGLPFEQVVELVMPPRSVAHTPVFQVMFSWQTLDASQAPAPAQADDTYVVAKFDLSLDLAEAGDTLAGGLEFATALFDRGTIERHRDYLVRALDAMVRDDTQPVDRLPLLGTPERERLLDEWNSTDTPFPGDPCLHELFEDWAARTPGAQAVVDAQGSMRYGELNAAANGLAHRLVALGVQPDSRVAICLPRSVDMVVAVLAVLKAGGAYVPLDPSAPAQRQADMLRDSGAAVLIVSGVPSGDLTADVAVLDITMHASPAAVDNLPRAARGLEPRHLAYVLYTSGSTGRPKGVMVEHRSVCNQVRALQARYRLSPRDRVLQFASLGFDMSVEEIFGALCSGAALVLRTDDWLSGASEFYARCREHGVTVCNLPTIFWQQLLQDDEPVAKTLRQMMIGGDAVGAQAVSAWFSRGGHRPAVFNAYGPTEATVNATVHELRPDARDWQCIGRPLPNTRVYLLDRHGEPVPTGTAGELHIGGEGVARGYLNRPELTAERFVADPFAGTHGARMYKTGDLARHRPDGRIVYLGRNDFQIKLRGFRIEPGEIEVRLAQHPGVREAVVVVREDVPGDRRLVAYFTPRTNGIAVDPAALREHLSTRLPDYMVPSAFVALDTIPVTSNRKLDRDALPAPQAGALVAREHEAPHGETELAIARVWAELLNVDRVGRHDDFFQLGGHSLMVMRMISRLRKLLGVEIGMTECFMRPILADFASAVQRAARSVLPPIVPVSRDRPLPLSFAQQRLWFVSQIEASSQAYHMPLGLRLAGPLDAGALRRALDRLVARHESLRTTFRRGATHPVQNIAPPDIGFPLAEHDLRALPPETREEDLERRIAEEATAPFDLATGPLARGQLLRVDDEDHVLLVTMHHIVSDGWSMGVLTREMNLLYQAFRQRRPDPLAPLSIQYADYAQWQRQWVDGDVLHAQADHWRETLRDAPELLALPTDLPRPPQPDHAGGFVGLQLDAALAASLKTLSLRSGTTLFMVLLAGWSILLSRLAGQRDVVIGTPVANRGHAEIEPLIGFFLNTLALRVDLAGAPPVGAFLQRVKAVTLAAQANQDLPFEQVVEIARPARSLAHSPLYQATFTWQTREADELVLPGLAVAGVGAPHATAKHDVSLYLSEVDDGIAGGLEYATALFHRRTVERFAAMLVKVLRGLVEDDTRAIDDLPLLDDAQRETLLVQWNATDAPYPDRHCAHQLIEAQVAATPHATALAMPSHAPLSYAELNQRANRLARHLRKQGVVPDARVALCLRRGIDLVVAVLAVWKAGGAYVPLDPSLPPARLTHMLGDSAPVLLLTNEDLQEQVAAALRLCAHEHGIGQVDLDADVARWARQSGEDLPVADVGVGPDHLAYVLYTSGSTGAPKGVMVAHRGVCNLASAQIDAFVLRPDSRVLQFASIGFDASVSEIVTTLASGACLCLAPPDEALAGATLVARVEEAAITHATLPPAVLTALDDDQLLSSLRTLVVAGEACSAAIVARFAPGRLMINAYGPTEASVCATMQRCDPADAGAPAIGRPMANTRIYLLDDALRPVPPGAAGEIHVGGVGLARGYLNRPELDRERFIDDPFRPGERLYKTGDLGRYLDDGRIAYIGRNDFQVKLRGLRIELGEIEATLAAQPSVREAVVLALDDVSGGRRLVAYCIARDDLDVTALREALSRTLPDYMVPAAIVALERWPLTANGKLDRKALPSPDTHDHATRRHEPPQGDVEQALARIWSQLLGVPRIGRHDDFFDLGGHSLLAVKLASLMREEGLHADVRTLFDAPTVARLAASVGAGSEQQVEVPTNGIPDACTHIEPAMLPLVVLDEADIERIVSRVPGGAANVQDIYPLAPLQEGILFHHLMSAQGDVYLSPTLFSFDRPERLDAFVDALQTVISRHDILRTAVQWESLGEPVQVVWRSAPLAVQRFEFNPAAGDIAGQLKSRFDPRQTRIELHHAPMMAAGRAADATNGRWLLVLLTHHMFIDHTTQEGMREEVQLILQGRGAELPPPLPFRNFVAQARLGVSREAHEAFFREMLGDVDDTTAPFGVTDVQGDGAALREARLAVEPLLAASLQRGARALGVTAAAVCHLAWAQVLARNSGRDDVVFGTVLFGRMQGGEGAHRVLGMFINTLPIRVKVDRRGVGEAVRDTHALLARLLRHEHAPLVLAQRCSGVAAPAPLFSALLNYRHGGGEEVAPTQTPAHSMPESAAAAFEGLSVESDADRTNFPLTLNVDNLGDHWSLNVQAVLPIDAEAVCAQVHEALARLADAMAHTPELAAIDVDVLPAEQKARLVEGFNATRTPYPHESTVHGLFENQAARTPEALAVEHEGVRLSFAELNHRANRLAHHLRRRGAKPGVRVALCLARGPEMLVALLAVMKSGAAYVPLDPDHPAERLRDMLADSSPTLVLGCRADLAGVDVPVVDPAADVSDWAQEVHGDPEPLASSLDLAYVIYTSGSTGQPKGVMVPHQGVVNLLESMRLTVQAGPRDRVLALTTLSFDIAALELYLPLVCGACCVLADRATAHDPQALAHAIESGAITLMQATPATWRMLLDADWAGRRGLRALSGGEALPSDLAARLLPRVDRLWNVYGPTETTIWSSAMAVQADTLAEAPIVSIGRPLANTRLYVLDAHGRPSPVGVTGELAIGGVGVARGYLDRAELTAERFGDDPLALDPSDRFDGEATPRLYRTGDLARRLADGRLEFLGRNDFQIKLRGYRIEPGEIEARLTRHSGVREAVVMAREDTPGDQRLVACLTLRDGALEDVPSWQRHLAEVLPEHMVPSVFVTVATMPLTANGKLDRKALLQAASAAERPHEPPEGEVEISLARTWEQVLKVEHIGRRDDFFSLGGHSLLVMKVVSLLKHSNLDITVADLFKHPTIASLAALVRQGHTGGTTEGAVPVRVSGTRLPLFLIHENTGQDLWFPWLAEHLDAQTPIYGLPAVPIDQLQLRTIEAMATRLVRMMRAVQPDGPYRIAGWSLGGILAYEAAVQLTGQDQEVEFLGLLDTECPLPGEGDDLEPPRAPSEPAYLLDLAAEVVRDVPLDTPQLEAIAELRGAADTLGFEAVFRRCVEGGILPAAISEHGADDVRRYVARLIAHEQAIEHYAVQPLSVPVHLFVAMSQPGGEATVPLAKSSWETVVPREQIRVVPVEGDHYTLLAAPNVAGLAAAIDGALAQPKASNATPPERGHHAHLFIQSGQRGQVPLFCVPGAGDSVIGFVSLAGAVGAERPVIGLQQRGVEGSFVPHSTVEAAAASCLGAVDALQPAGPLHLLGHSFGGWVVFEMAQQLAARGRRVASLTIVDSEAPDGQGLLGQEYTSTAVLIELIRLMEMSSEKCLGIDFGRFERCGRTRQLRLLHEGMVRVSLLPKRSDPDAMRGVIRAFSAALRTRYRPREAYAEHVRLVLARDPNLSDEANRSSRQEALDGWSRWAPQLTCWDAPGNHFSILKPPHVATLAQWWRSGVAPVVPSPRTIA